MLRPSVYSCPLLTPKRKSTGIFLTCAHLLPALNVLFLAAERGAADLGLYSVSHLHVTP